MQNTATIKMKKQYTKKKKPAFKVHLLKQESVRTLYRDRLKGKLTPLTGEIDADRGHHQSSRRKYRIKEVEEPEMASDVE